MESGQGQGARKHGVAFEVSRAVFDGEFAVEEPDDATDEDRFKRIGMVSGGVAAVVCTMHGNRIRIISDHMATKHEQADYVRQKP
jgi:uncharacterized DUF497 family protein